MIRAIIWFSELCGYGMRQMYRGTGHLPHVGSHPGSLWIVIFAIMGALAGGIVGVAVMVGVFGPVYLWGAYDRANLSDRIERGK